MRIWLLFISAMVGWAHPAVSVVMDSRGDVYYSDTAQVLRIARDGSKSVVVPRVHTHELWMDEKDNLYGEHLEYAGGQWSHRIWCRSSDGQISDLIPTRKGFLQDYRDFSFLRDRHGAMYWIVTSGAEYTILRKAPGAAVQTLTKVEIGQIGWTSALPDGGVIIADHASLVRVAADGKVRRLAGLVSQKQERHAVMGVWTDGAGNLYAADTSGGAVKKITPSGKISSFAVSTAPWRPVGGLMVPDGTSWILEVSASNAQRLRRVAGRGGSRVF